MDTLSLLRSLSAQMQFEVDGCSNYLTAPIRRQDDIYITSASLPNGKQIRLLKTLLTSVCEYDCAYCGFRSGRDFRRATFKPDEFARTFMHLIQLRAVDGLFISSGITKGSIFTQDKLIETVEILRGKHHFKGYIHLKIMPGAEMAQIVRAMELADRVSVNLEAPNKERLTQLSPHKDFTNDIMQSIHWINKIRADQNPGKSHQGKWPSVVTQFVAGGADESDFELLTTTQYLYHQLNLQRTYFMAFNPVPDTPLENKRPTDPLRELRLYQASFLLRDYGFQVNELPFVDLESLPLDTDPKFAWAQVHLADSPIEINHADQNELMRIPGIGPKSAISIIKLRLERKINELNSLRALHINTERVAPFILINGRRPVQQLTLL